MTKEEKSKQPKGTRLQNPQWEIFCRLFSGSNKEFFGNATKCYMQAFGYDEKWWAAQEIKAGCVYGSAGYREQRKIQLGIDKICSVSGNRLLGKASIVKRCDELLDEILTDIKVDRERGRVIMQNKDYASKIKAIETYDKLKARINDKVKLEGDIEIKWADAADSQPKHGKKSN